VTQRSYRLLIEVAVPVKVQVGRLGEFDFAPGRYVYTGSARRNIDQRIARHLRREKRLRWHIDYLLNAPGVRILSVERSPVEECELNQHGAGKIAVPGFGASDCRHGCGSHLKYLGETFGEC
jgi:Uri superfamily endonuclease